MQLLLLLAVERAAQQPSSADDLARPKVLSLEVAAKGLIQMWKGLTPEPAQGKEQATQILQRCVQDEEKMVAEATKKGADRNVELTPGGSPGPVHRCRRSSSHEHSSVWTRMRNTSA